MDTRNVHKHQRTNDLPTAGSPYEAETPSAEWTSEIRASPAFTSFADSTIWDDQTRFFEEFGSDAWTARVPYHVTNNINIATSAAQVALAFMRDYATSHPGSDTPFPIVELGTGIGRFGYYFTRALLDLAARLPGPEVSFIYWMTDRAESNLSYLRSHPLIAQQIAAGNMKLGIYDPTTGTPIRDATGSETVQNGGNPIPPFERPVIVFANYFFDSLPVDVIRLQDGTMEILCVSGSAQLDPDLGRNEILSIDELGLDTQWQPIATRQFSKPSHGDLVQNSVRRFGDQGWLIFPTAGLHCLDSLRTLSGSGYLLAASDKGLLPSEVRIYGGMPRVAFHGAVSTGVNFPLLAQYVEAGGGWSAAQASRQSLITVLLNTVADWDSLPGTRFWAEQALNDQGHIHLFNTYQAFCRAQGSFEFSLAQLLSLFNLARWDPIVLTRLWPAAKSALPESRAERDELRRGVQRSRDMYFPVPGDDEDVGDILDRYLQLADRASFQ